MAFSLHQGGVVMSSQIPHKQSSTYTDSLPIYMTPAPWFSVVAPFSVVEPKLNSQPNYVTASHPSPCDNRQSTWGRFERSLDQAKRPREAHSVTYAPGPTTFSYLSRIVALPPPSVLCCPRPPLHLPSSLPSVSFVPALRLLPPSTPFRPYFTHLFFLHAQTISILSDLLYSLTPFLFQLSYAPLHS